MRDADNSSNPSFADFGKFVPGFDFLQNLATQAAGSAAQKSPQLPSLGSWVAPTLNVEELDRRIAELKAVQFWLDQNATALKATIQALEVQKMTLATLKGMNFNMGDVANAFKLKVADTAKTFAGLEIPAFKFQASPAADEASDNAEAEAEVDAPAKATSAKAGSAAAPAAGGVVDPLQWWGALTQQFQTIAADAMKEAAQKTALDATQGATSSLAKEAMKNATGLAKQVAKNMTGSAGKTVADGALAAMNTALRSSQSWPTPTAAKTTRATVKTKTAPVKAAAPARKTARKTSR